MKSPFVDLTRFGLACSWSSLKSPFVPTSHCTLRGMALLCVKRSLNLLRHILMHIYLVIRLMISNFFVIVTLQKDYLFINLQQIYNFYNKIKKGKLTLRAIVFFTICGHVGLQFDKELGWLSNLVASQCFIYRCETRPLSG